jgi:hypothetical protein
VQLAIAHPFTDRELARIVQATYHLSVDHRGIRRVLEWHHLSPDVLKHRRQQAQQTLLPAPPPDPQLALPFEPTTLAQRLAQALGPEHLMIRFRTYREYPTEEQARWRIIELLEVGFRPRRVAALLAIQPPVVYPSAVSANLLYGFGRFNLRTVVTGSFVALAAPGEIRASGGSVACTTPYARVPA